MSRFLPLLALLASLPACDARQPTLDPAEPLPPPGCVVAEPAELRFDAVGEARTLTLSGCGAAPGTVVGMGLAGDTAAFALTIPEVPFKAPTWGRELTVGFAGPRDAHDAVWVLPDGAETPLRVPLLGPDAGRGCPTLAIQASPQGLHPLDVLALDGAAWAEVDGTGEPLVGWRWTVLDRPPGSTAHVVEAIADPAWPQRGGPEDDPATPGGALFLDLAGRYRLGLTVTDSRGVEAPGPTCPAGPGWVVDVVPEAAIHVQLVWHTPADPDEADIDGSDLDLHLRRAGGRWGEAGDCFYAQRAASWPPAGAVGDATLDIDDVDGQGPENINVVAPHADGAPYEIGVHAFRLYVDPVGRVQPTEATVRVYLDGVEAAAWRRTLTDHEQFWTVARVEVDAEGTRVVPVDALDPTPP